MKQAEIIQTIVKYLAKNNEKFKDALPEPNFYLVMPADPDDAVKNTKILKGALIDVVAELIESKRFFGSYVPSEVNQADNPNNTRISLLTGGTEVYGIFYLQISADKVIIEQKDVEKKSYLNILRKPEGFLQAATLYGIEGDLEKIASTLYVRE